MRAAGNAPGAPQTTSSAVRIWGALGADVMRDYDDNEGDDHIRLYTPVFQRVIILAAVIIAVPVMMWTITTFVRSYVARPKVPGLEHVASASPRVPAISAAPSSAAPPEPSASLRLNPAASDPPSPPAESKKSNVAALPDSTAALRAAASNPPVPSIQAPPAPTPVITASAAAAGDAPTGTATVPSPPRLPQPAPQRSGENTASTSASTDRAIAWPNPNTTSPPDFSAPRLAPPPARPSQRVAPAQVLPAAEPLRGPIPLPRQRPGVFAMAATGPVPLPRVRPGDPPAVASTAIETSTTSRSDIETPH